MAETEMNSFDEKKEEHPSLIPEKPPAAVPVAPIYHLSPSKRRAKAAGSAGLSELSKQLRILQAKNESQSVDINRLERQLRILAELQGISVADLRKALEDACANEAFGEMQHRVAKLRADLEAATLAKRAELRKDASAPHIANLELRVGELEEVEEKQQAEIHHLYEQLQHERARATRLEAEAEQHKKDAADYLDRLNKESARAAHLEANFQEQIRKLHEEYGRKLKEQALAQQAANASNIVGASKDENASKDANASNGPNASTDATGTSMQSISPQIAADYERMVKLLKEKDEELRQAKATLQAEREQWMQRMKENDGQSREAQTNMKLDQDKMTLVIKQLQDADSQSDLRLAQFKARFAMQDERIQDMEQQLNSLYTAFGLIKEDQDSEDLKRVALASNLGEADAEIARQVEDMERRKMQGGKAGSMMSTPGKGTAQGIPREITTPSTVASSPGYGSATPTRGYESPMPAANATPISARTATATPISLSGTRAFASPQPSTPTTWQLLFPENRSSSRSFSSMGASNGSGALMSGMLLIKSKSVMRKWKQKFAKLYLSGNHYLLDLGEGKSYMIGFGISKVEFNPNHSLSFIVYTNPHDSMAPVVHAAAVTEDDYHRWMAALTKATTGNEYGGGQESSPRRSEAAPASPQARGSFHFSSSDSISLHSRTPSAEEQDAANLQRALELSKSQV